MCLDLKCCHATLRTHREHYFSVCFERNSPGFVSQLWINCPVCRCSFGQTKDDQELKIKMYLTSNNRDANIHNPVLLIKHAILFVQCNIVW